ncbi:MAG TPA: SPW repeat protein [Methylophilaceae bacterium]|jgi:hypothetical protein|nr:SPW repeat protein [Methylophilaceae bacterium]
MSLSIKHWQDPLNLILGLWLIASPWVLPYSAETYATWNAIIIGTLVVLLAVSEVYMLKAWEEWTSVALGVWLMISPWILGFSGNTMAMWNAVGVGLAVAVLALWVLGTDKQIGGGWWHPVT